MAMTPGLRYGSKVWFWIAIAPAAPVMLYEHDVDTALGRLRRQTGPIEAAPARLVPPTEVSLLGGRLLERCTAPRTTRQEVRETLLHAEQHREAGEADGWEEGLEVLEQGWPCVEGPVDRVSAGRLHLLFALRAAHLDRSEEATRQLRRAWTFDPDLVLPEPFLALLGPSAEEARRPVAEVRLRRVGSDPLWIDGLPVEVPAEGLMLSAGEHLLQLPGQTLLAQLEAEEVWLVGDDAEHRLTRLMRSEQGREEVVARAAVLGHDRLLVPRVSGTWSYEAGHWRTLRPDLRERAATPTLVSGLAMALGGALWMGAEAAAAQTRIDSHFPEQLDSRDQRRLVYRHQEGRVRWVAAGVTLGAGLAVSLTGVVLHLPTGVAKP